MCDFEPTWICQIGGSDYFVPTIIRREEIVGHQVTRNVTGS